MGGKSKIESLLSHLGEGIPEIHYYEATDSTNTRAKEYANSRSTGATSPAVFIAEEQTHGRGRLGRSFSSARGGVYISFLVYPRTSAEKATALTAYAAVRLTEVVRTLVGVEPKIKWVNDLYLGDRKLAGILTEGSLAPDGTLSYAVCGIGINLVKSAISPELSEIATSIEEEAGAVLDPALLAARITDAFLSDLDNCLSPVYLEEYKRLSLTLGQTVTVLTEPPYGGVAVDILPDYSLLVDANGERRRVYTGEVSIRHKK